MNFKKEFYGRTYKYALDILNFVKSLPKDTAVYVLEKQLIRSATSVAANLLEAKAASSKRDYVNFYAYSLKSGNESMLWLNLLKDYLAPNNAECQRLISETDEICKILAASILTMKGRRDSKPSF